MSVHMVDANGLVVCGKDFDKVTNSTGALGRVTCKACLGRASGATDERRTMEIDAERRTPIVRVDDSATFDASPDDPDFDVRPDADDAPPDEIDVAMSEVAAAGGRQGATHDFGDPSRVADVVAAPVEVKLVKAEYSKDPTRCMDGTDAAGEWPTVTHVVDARGAARARNSDPDTSHAAAKSVMRRTATMDSILACFFQPTDRLTDQGIAIRFMGEQVSPSGLRTRRAELVRLGRIRNSGKKHQLESGRMSILWELTNGDTSPQPKGTDDNHEED